MYSYHYTVVVYQSVIVKDQERDLYTYVPGSWGLRRGRYTLLIGSYFRIDF